MNFYKFLAYFRKLVETRSFSLAKQHRNSLHIRAAGFTLIELLVVVAIIALLSSLITFSVSQARLKSRDARRISDLKQIKSGTDLYFSTDGGYPDTGTWVPGSTLTCNAVIVLRIPDDPSAPVYHYTYTGSGASAPGCGGTVRRGYSVQFYIENKAASYTMDEDGVVRDSSDNPVSFDSLL